MRGDAGLTAQELCDTYAQRVYGFAAMVAGCPADADDLAQTALERALRALPRLDGRDRVEGWLWRIVVNAARDAGRVERRRRRLFDRLAAVRGEDDELVPAVAARDDELIDAIRRLPPRQRAVVALRYGADLDWAAVARTLDTTSGAARLLNHRALRSLRGALTGGGHDHA
jgi:RNA polymerase sigma factor (sigma-70 family)